MALDTYSGLKTTIADYLNRDDLTSAIPSFITLAEAKDRYQIETRKVNDLKDLLSDGNPTIAIHEQDAEIDKLVTKHDRDAELLTFVSEARLIKDQYEIDEMQSACDASELGFQEIVKAMPAAVAHPRGERVIEAAFFTKARTEGNDVG
jgi:Xaa-Pro aminopeptidase